MNSDQMARFTCDMRRVPLWVIVLYACVFLLIWSQQPGGTEESQINVVSRDVDNLMRGILGTGQSNNCGLRTVCPEGTFPFSVTSGAGQKVKPRMCYNSSYQVFWAGQMGRGMNLLLINKKLQMPIEERTFDIFEMGDSSFLEYLERVNEGDIIFLATHDDAFSRLSYVTKLYLKEQFGSHDIISLNFRGSWVFVGQKGSPTAGFFEAVSPRSKGQLWAHPARVEGCLSFPMKILRTPHCGLSTTCEVNSTAVNIVSASLENTALLPVYFCVNGRESFADIGTEGMNLLVYDLFWGSVVKSQSFDTHTSVNESNDMVDFLNSVTQGQILIGAVYDDASRWLSVHARDVLESFGALKISGLTYKGMWAFVGMRGIKGASPFEELNPASGVKDKRIAKVEITACIPDRIEGFQVIHPSELRRRSFCKKYPSYHDLCSAKEMTVLKLLPLDDMSLYKNIAYRTPILVMGGTDLRSLQRCMDSLLKVPGLNRDLVYVALEDHFTEPSDLVVLYGFKVREQRSGSTYGDNFRRALSRSLTFHPDNPYVIVLETDLEVSPDFLRYFSQTLHLLEQDRSLLTISAWNPNGYVNTSGDPQLTYRTEDFPGLGWVLTRPLMEEMSKNKFECCKEATWKNWFRGESRRGRESVIPDVSRVRRSLPPGFTMDTPFLRRYLKDRLTSNNSKFEPTDTFKVTYKQYETEIKSLIGRSRLLNTSILRQCLTDGTALPTSLSFESSAIYTVYYKQNSPEDISILSKLATCFGLFIPEDEPYNNWHESIVRFTRNHSKVLLIGSNSKYFTEKPKQCYNCDAMVP